MHVVASKPLFLSKELISTEVLESEREILRSQAEASGKPKMAIEKMVEGRLRKYFEEVVFMEQKYVVDDCKSVKTVLDELSKEVGSPVKIGNYVRVEVGEGIERQEESEPVAQAA
uniref:Elongation factor Ts, mitochondrial n=1 Tax=Opuntia streptacantha TaxID=393608 RepID=A0A7C9A7R2_OPUST